MSIVLFAIIGATIDVGCGYWICFSAFCIIKLINLIIDIAKAINESEIY